MKNKSGFTLIEIMITTAMVAVISLAIYSSFNSGIRVWQRLKEPLNTEGLNISFDKLKNDAANCFKLKGIGFIGTDTSVEFATLVKLPPQGQRTVGKVSYVYDQYDKSLTRKESDYSAIFSRKEPREGVALKNIKSLKFSYFHFDKEKNKYDWLDEWKDPEKLPLALRIELELPEKQGYHIFAKTVSIPLRVKE